MTAILVYPRIGNGIYCRQPSVWNRRGCQDDVDIQHFAGRTAWPSDIQMPVRFHDRKTFCAYFPEMITPESGQ